MSWLLAGWCLGVGGAAAQAPTSTPPAGSQPELGKWVTADRRARTVYKAGIAVGATGLGLDLLGLATNSEALVLAGGIGELVGAPIMTGASLRSARALEELGGQPERAWGYTGWGLVAADVGFRVASAASTETDPDLSAQLRLVAILAEIGAYTSAVLQQLDNGAVRKDLQLRTSTPLRRRRIRVAFAPMAGRSPGISMLLVRE